MAIRMTRPMTIRMTRPMTIRMTRPMTIRMTRPMTIRMTRPMTIRMPLIRDDAHDFDPAVRVIRDGSRRSGASRESFHRGQPLRRGANLPAMKLPMSPP
jgi:hypothetical protein